tara:strand:+ start:110 stop:295 length:186 start_codon:yes stop_codon:yes gene_type:complete
MMTWAKILFPINRSITGEGLRKTIKFIKEKVNKKFKKKELKAVSKFLTGRYLVNGKSLQHI